MTTTTEAQRITGIDRGKHVKFDASFSRIITGKLVQMKHLGDGGPARRVQNRKEADRMRRCPTAKRRFTMEERTRMDE